MPTPSNSKPRRIAPSTAPPAVAPTRRASSRASNPRTADLSAPRPTPNRPPASRQSAPKKTVDPGVKRRAQKKTQARQRGFLAWMIALAITVMIAGAAAGVRAELASTRARVAQKRATLSDLSAQLEIGKKRLRALASSGGKERVLVENGFIKPGERLLLFPKKPMANRQ